MAGMMDFFTGAKPPQVQPAPLPPSQDATALKQQADAAAEQRRMAAGGKASTFMTSPLGDVSTANLATKTLMGQA